MYLKQNIPRSSFLSFFDDFRYAGATIVALCSQGLSKNLNVIIEFDADWFKISITCKPTF
jgi:hypothetical protein